MEQNVHDEKHLADEYGITVRSEFVPFSKSHDYEPGLDPQDKCLNWKVTIVYKGRDIITQDYMAGIGYLPSYKNYNIKDFGQKYSIVHCAYMDAELENGYQAVISHQEYVAGMSFPIKIDKNKPILPDSVGVVWSLLNDARAIDYACFEDWADDYGYDSDSRKAEKIYNDCLAIGLKLRAGLGENLIEKLRDTLLDY